MERTSDANIVIGHDLDWWSTAGRATMSASKAMCRHDGTRQEHASTPGKRTPFESADASMCRYWQRCSQRSSTSLRGAAGTSPEKRFAATSSASLAALTRNSWRSLFHYTECSQPQGWNPDAPGHNHCPLNCDWDHCARHTSDHLPCN